ncbi:MULTISPECIES: NAD-dependent epimerase/dehydratase family protein [Persicobacter]|uniref:dTDP-glucose 4,6-dehydratase n=1 Tax=Persicobacter diffluens TaxID=981 RepID=A0AAN5AIS3_9BACT|nr:SDR family oxidoreductase [Persicobacter sp. CCB-QB2]GJM60174.1 dTDP-glucose 4,6-dehydratase [Persicobacter diffluens]
MKILVTGGAGYIGTELSRLLVNHPEVDELIVYDNLSRANYNLFLGRPTPNGHKIKFIKGDILDGRKLSKALEGVDVVYHFAAHVSTPLQNNEVSTFEQVNHWGTANVVDAVEASDSVKMFVYLSSVSVYGDHTDQMLTEETAPMPKSLYAVSKFRGEEHVNRLKDKIRTFIIRSGNVYGYSKTMRFDAVINRFMFESHYSNRIQIHGDGKQRRAFIHVSNLVNVLYQMIRSKTPSGVYNMVEKNLQVLDIVDVLKELYPSLEFIFVNQHLSLKELMVSPDSKLWEYVKPLENRPLQEELEDFRREFTM